MADPFSSLANAAAVIGLADMLCRAGKDLYLFFSAVRAASRDIQNMLEELRQLQVIVTSVQTLATNYVNSPFAGDDGLRLSLSAIAEALKGCQVEFTFLKDLTDKAGAKQQSRAGNSLATKVKWVLDGNKITQSCQKLERLKNSLSNALSVAGRNNDLKVRAEIKSVREDIETAGANLQSIDLKTTAVQAGIQTIDLKTTTIEAHLQNIISETTALDSNIQGSRVANSRSFRAVNSQIMQARTQASRGFHTISKDLKRTRIYHQRQNIQFQDALRSQVRQGMDELRSTFASLAPSDSSRGILRDIAFPNQGTVQLQDCVLPLILLKPKLTRALAVLAADSSMDVSRTECDYLLSEFDKVLAASHEASAASIRGDASLKEKTTSSNYHCTPAELSQAIISNDMKPLKGPHDGDKSLHSKRQQVFSRRIYWDRSDESPIYFTVANESGPENYNLVKILSTCFIPVQKICQLGILVQFRTSMISAANPQIDRLIRVFNVLDREHEAFTACLRGDVVTLRKLLTSRKITLWDRDEAGSGLMWYAVIAGAYDVCQLLLQEGATTHDCLLGRWNAAIGVWGSYHANPWKNRSTIEDLVRLSNLFNLASISAENDDFWFLTLVRLLCDSKNSSYEEIIRCFQALVSFGFSIENRDTHGFTPLLYSAFIEEPSSELWLRLLIQKNAKIAAIDHGGCGVLHLMFRNGLCNSHSRWRKVVTLLQAGCDPNLVAGDGRTPGEYAKQDPPAEMVWEAALAYVNGTHGNLRNNYFFYNPSEGHFWEFQQNYSRWRYSDRSDKREWEQFIDQSSVIWTYNRDAKILIKNDFVSFTKLKLGHDIFEKCGLNEKSMSGWIEELNDGDVSEGSDLDSSSEEVCENKVDQMSEEEDDCGSEDLETGGVRL